MLFEALRTRAAALPVSAGLRRHDEFISYQDVVERIERAAAHLVARGVEPGQRVALLLPASPALFAVSYALFAIGAVAVPVGPQSSRRELAWLAGACGIAAIVLAPGHEAVADGLDPTGSLPRLLATNAGLFSPVVPVSLPPVPGTTDAVFQFSSGSTGRPKVVPHTHAEMLADGTAVANTMRLTTDDVVLNTLPAHHAFGFMAAHFEAVAGGATTLFWSDPQPLMMARSRLLETLAQGQVTVMPGVPLVFDMLAGTSGEVDLGRLRLAYSAGVGLRRPVFERFRDRFGIALRQGYGATEVGLMTLNMEADADLYWNSVGRPVAGVQFEVLPHPDAPPGIGELLVRSPSLARGYLDAPEAAAAAFVDGGFRTGDLGHVDADGNVFITGRAKLLIEVAGQKVDPIEVEDVLAGHPEVAEAVVIGIPSPRTGEQELRAVIVRRGEVEIGDLIALCRASLSPHKVPVEVEFRDEIPRSGAGKVLRGRLMDV